MICNVTEDFVEIKEAKEALKGSFKGIIIKAGDLKSGTKNGKDWTKKIFIIEDESGQVDLVTWDDEIKNFSVGYTYEIVNPWWKTYENKITVQVGKYGTAKVIGSEKSIPDTPPPPKEQTVSESGSQSAPKPDSPQITQSKGRTDEPKIVTLSDIELATVEDATVKLLAISLAVGEKVKEVTEVPSREFVMEATKIIYNKFFASNFKKASDTR